MNILLVWLTFIRMTCNNRIAGKKREAMMSWYIISTMQSKVSPTESPTTAIFDGFASSNDPLP